MIYCGCKNRFKLTSDHCPYCGTKFTEYNAVFISNNRWEEREKKLAGFKWFNSTSIMFVDENKIKISLFMLSLRYVVGAHYPMMGECAFSLNIRYDIKKRTAVAYTKNVSCSDDIWEDVKLPRFLNFTQPCGCKVDRYDIVLPDEMVADFCKIIGVEKPDKPIGVTELAWLNRTRVTLNEAMRENYILSSFINRMQFRYEESAIIYYKKISDKMKRYLKSRKKTKDYDECIFLALCKTHRADINIIPNNLIKYYYMNPVALRYVDMHLKLYKNRDVCINAILNEVESGSMSYMVSSKADVICEVFDSDIKIYNKVKGNSEYIMLADTARMIKDIRKAGYTFKTKGSLQKLHDEAWKMSLYASVPRGLIFENVKQDKSITIGNYNFNYAKSSDELIDISMKMNHCVATYYSACQRSTKIVYATDKKDNMVACLEISKRRNSFCNESPNDTYVYLNQAKGHSNSKTSIHIQKLILEFCNMNNITISTCDIYENIRNNNKVYLGLINKTA